MILPSPGEPYMLEAVFGKNNSKVISDKRQLSLATGIENTGTIALKKRRGNMLICKTFCCVTPF